MNTLQSAEPKASTPVPVLPATPAANVPTGPTENPPPAWANPLAFALLYISWGTTFLAIRIGVHDEQLPPALFAGTRLAAAGLVLLAYQFLRGAPCQLPRADFFWLFITSVLMFVGGNGLITLALGDMPTGVTSIMSATLPLWLAMMESVWPGGERLALRGWLGLLIGLAGVGLVAQLHSLSDIWQNPGPLYVMGSAIFWALGSLLVKQHRPSVSHLTAASYQMIVGGTALALVGCAVGECSQLTQDHFNVRTTMSFVYLLVVGSLIGYLAYTWLLNHVSPTLVGTYAYVNPVVAVVVGWLLAGEELTPRILTGMAIVLGSVALVRRSPRPHVAGAGHSMAPK